MPDLSWTSIAAIAGALLAFAYLAGAVFYWRDFRRIGYRGWRWIVLWPVARVGGWLIAKAFEHEERR